MRFSLRTLLVALAVAPLLIAAVICVPQVAEVGHIPLTLRFINETGKTIQRIEGAAVGKREYADWHVKVRNEEQPPWRSIALDGDGVGELHLMFSRMASQFTGVEFSYYQPQALVIKVDFTDGSQSLFAADVPKRGIRHLDITLPPR